jgi:hypothetical protein
MCDREIVICTDNAGDTYANGLLVENLEQSGGIIVVRLSGSLVDPDLTLPETKASADLTLPERKASVQPIKIKPKKLKLPKFDTNLLSVGSRYNKTSSFIRKIFLL